MDLHNDFNSSASQCNMRAPPNLTYASPYVRKGIYVNKNFSAAKKVLVNPNFKRNVHINPNFAEKTQSVYVNPSVFRTQGAATGGQSVLKAVEGVRTEVVSVPARLATQPSLHQVKQCLSEQARLQRQAQLPRHQHSLTQRQPQIPPQPHSPQKSRTYLVQQPRLPQQRPHFPRQPRLPQFRSEPPAMQQFPIPLHFTVQIPPAQPPPISKHRNLVQVAITENSSIRKMTAVNVAQNQPIGNLINVKINAERNELKPTETEMLNLMNLKSKLMELKPTAEMSGLKSTDAEMSNLMSAAKPELTEAVTTRLKSKERELDETEVSAELNEINAKNLRPEMTNLVSKMIKLKSAEVETTLLSSKMGELKSSEAENANFKSEATILGVREQRNKAAEAEKTKTAKLDLTEAATTCLKFEMKELDSADTEMINLKLKTGEEAEMINLKSKTEEEAEMINLKFKTAELKSSEAENANVKVETANSIPKMIVEQTTGAEMINFTSEITELKSSDDVIMKEKLSENVAVKTPVNSKTLLDVTYEKTALKLTSEAFEFSTQTLKSTSKVLKSSSQPLPSSQASKPTSLATKSTSEALKPTSQTSKATSQPLKSSSQPKLTTQALKTTPQALKTTPQSIKSSSQPLSSAQTLNATTRKSSSQPLLPTFQPNALSFSHPIKVTRYSKINKPSTSTDRKLTSTKPTTTNLTYSKYLATRTLNRNKLINVITAKKSPVEHKSTYKIIRVNTASNKFKVDNRQRKPSIASPQLNKRLKTKALLMNLDPQKQIIKTAKVRKFKIVKIKGVKYQLNPQRTLLFKLGERRNVKSVKKIVINGVLYVRKDEKTYVRQYASNLVKINKIMLSKDNSPCLTYRKTGKCKPKSMGKCFKLHDPKQISVCIRFLQGACIDKCCTLSHNVSSEKMPTCKYFLEGRCSNDGCPYLHVKLGKDAKICTDFLKGYCTSGLQCMKRHQFLCPAYEGTGSCGKRLCPYPHGDRVRHFAVKLVNKIARTTSTSLKRRLSAAQNSEAEEACGKNRYYVGENNVGENCSEVGAAGLLKRPKLGDLPSFIALE